MSTEMRDEVDEDEDDEEEDETVQTKQHRLTLYLPNHSLVFSNTTERSLHRTSCMNIYRDRN